MSADGLNPAIDGDRLPPAIDPDGNEVDHDCVFRRVLRDVAVRLAVHPDTLGRYDTTHIGAALDAALGFPRQEQTVSHMAVMDPEDMRNTGDVLRSTEALIRIVDQDGVEVDVLAYDPDDDEGRSFANADTRLLDSPWRPRGDQGWAFDAGQVARIPVDPA